MTSPTPMPNAARRSPSEHGRAMTRRPHATAPAFTVIELMVTMGIIVLLSAIFVFAYRNVGTAGQIKSTRTLLSQLKSAVTESTNDRPSHVRFFAQQLPSIYFPPDATGSYQLSARASWIAVPAGSVESVQSTADVLVRLQGTPAARAIIEGLPTNSKRQIHINTNAVTVPVDAWGQPIVFVFDSLERQTGTTTTVPLTMGPATAQVQVGGLTNIYSDAAKEFWEPTTAFVPGPTYDAAGTTVTDTERPLSPFSRDTTYTAHSEPNPSPPPAVKIAQSLRAPDHQPFWMSAGPDHKYETTDDNIYSFEN